MNSGAIGKAFAELIRQRGIHQQLGIKSNYVQQLRYKLTHGIGISTDLKLQLLQKSGWRQSDHQYSQQDLVSLTKFILKAPASTKLLGVEYIVEKWQKTN